MSIACSRPWNSASFLCRIYRTSSAFVSRLHQQMVTPEEMLVRVKDILAQCGLRPAQPPHEKGSVPTGGSLYHHVIAWCIEQYYKDGST